jgi:hypothetical protein
VQGQCFIGSEEELERNYEILRALIEDYGATLIGKPTQLRFLNRRPVNEKETVVERFIHSALATAVITDIEDIAPLSDLYFRSLARYSPKEEAVFANDNILRVWFREKCSIFEGARGIGLQHWHWTEIEAINILFCLLFQRDLPDTYADFLPSIFDTFSHYDINCFFASRQGEEVFHAAVISRNFDRIRFLKKLAKKHSVDWRRFLYQLSGSTLGECICDARLFIEVFFEQEGENVRSQISCEDLHLYCAVHPAQWQPLCFLSALMFGNVGRSIEEKHLNSKGALRRVLLSKLSPETIFSFLYKNTLTWLTLGQSTDPAFFRDIMEMLKMLTPVQQKIILTQEIAPESEQGRKVTLYEGVKHFCQDERGRPTPKAPIIAYLQDLYEQVKDVDTSHYVPNEVVADKSPEFSKEDIAAILEAARMCAIESQEPPIKQNAQPSTTKKTLTDEQKDRAINFADNYHLLRGRIMNILDDLEMEVQLTGAPHLYAPLQEEYARQLQETEERETVIREWINPRDNSQQKRAPVVYEKSFCDVEDNFLRKTWAAQGNFVKQCKSLGAVHQLTAMRCTRIEKMNAIIVNAAQNHLAVSIDDVRNFSQTLATQLAHLNAENAQRYELWQQRCFRICTPKNVAEQAELKRQQEIIDELFGREIAADETLVAEDFRGKQLVVIDELEEYISRLDSIYGDQAQDYADIGLLQSALQVVGAEATAESALRLVGQGTIAEKLEATIQPALLEARRIRAGTPPVPAAADDAEPEPAEQLDAAPEPAVPAPVKPANEPPAAAQPDAVPKPAEPVVVNNAPEEPPANPIPPEYEEAPIAAPEPAVPDDIPAVPEPVAPANEPPAVEPDEPAEPDDVPAVLEPVAPANEPPAVEPDEPAAPDDIPAVPEPVAPANPIPLEYEEGPIAAPANNGFFAGKFWVIATIAGVSAATAAAVIYYLYFVRKSPVFPWLRSLA